MQLLTRCTRWTILGMAAGSLLALPVTARASHFHRGPTSTRSHKTKAGAGSSHSVVAHPRAIDDARATEIQGALVKAGYLQSSSGKWDDASADAMRKLQGDNGWQTKLIPDSRALIKLGLGPGSETSAGTAAAGTAAAGGGGGVSESTGALLHRDTISSTLVK